MEEGLFPHTNCMDLDELEEERRLCYVAITRAKKKLWLINAKKRLIYGRTDCFLPSRFIGEIDEECLEKDEVIDYKNTIDKTAEYSLGEILEHKIFGEGIIVGMDDKDLTIAFKNKFGIKKIARGHISLRRSNDA